MNKIALVILGSILIVVLALCGYLYFKLPKMAYIKTEEVYNEFKLKKELEGKLTKTQEARGRILDSLRSELELLSQSLQITKKPKDEEVNRFNVLRRNYMMKKEDFDKQNQELSAQYSQQIWKQLNQYIKEYGEENSYKYIFGVAGEGTLMYAEAKEDITSKVKEYVNGKYEGDIK